MNGASRNRVAPNDHKREFSMKCTQSYVTICILSLAMGSACGSSSGDPAPLGSDAATDGAATAAIDATLQGETTGAGGGAGATGEVAGATGEVAGATGEVAGATGEVAEATGGAAGGTGGVVGATGGVVGATGGAVGATGGVVGATGGVVGATGGVAGGTGGVVGGTGGVPVATGGSGSGTGGVPAGMCNSLACDECFSTPKNGPCAVLDNPCNDLPACNTKQDAWIDCICLADGDATKQAACDAAFTTAGSVSSEIIACTRTSCAVCYGSAGNVCPVQTAGCQACLENTCGAEVGACMGASSCKAVLSPMLACLCNAQDGKAGTIAGCLSQADAAGGTLAAAVTACGKTNCAAQCAF
jgi:hypothetical protein